MRPTSLVLSACVPQQASVSVSAMFTTRSSLPGTTPPCERCKTKTMVEASEGRYRGLRGRKSRNAHSSGANDARARSSGTPITRCTEPGGNEVAGAERDGLTDLVEREAVLALGDVLGHEALGDRLRTARPEPFKGSAIVVGDAGAGRGSGSCEEKAEGGATQATLQARRRTEAELCGAPRSKKDAEHKPEAKRGFFTYRWTMRLASFSMSCICSWSMLS